jgi:hypothetical protein
MNGFEIVDRYDIVMSFATGLVMVGALALGAELWVAALILLLGCVVAFACHFQEITDPD